jgi:hypothetical protein
MIYCILPDPKCQPPPQDFADRSRCKDPLHLYQGRVKAAGAELHSAVDEGVETVKVGKKRSILGTDENPRKRFK